MYDVYSYSVSGSLTKNVEAESPPPPAHQLFQARHHGYPPPPLKNPAYTIGGRGVTFFSYVVSCKLYKEKTPPNKMLYS